MSKQKVWDILKKHIKDFHIICEKSFKFDSYFLRKYLIYKNYNTKTIWDINVQRILIKIRKHNFYPAFYGDFFKLKTFTLNETSEKFDYVYHQTNTPPEVVLKQGLNLRYSFSGSKGFNPLIFVSKKPHYWHGEYTYKIKLRQKLYFDTNLNWQQRLGHSAFCLLQNIRPSDISLINADEAL
jgi:hypothetical protein